MEKGGGIIAVKTASSTLHDINVGFLLSPNYNDLLEYSKTILTFYPIHRMEMIIITYKGQIYVSNTFHILSYKCKCTILKKFEVQVTMSKHCLCLG